MLWLITCKCRRKFHDHRAVKTTEKKYYLQNDQQCYGINTECAACTENTTGYEKFNHDWPSWNMQILLLSRVDLPLYSPTTAGLVMLCYVHYGQLCILRTVQWSVLQTVWSVYVWSVYVWSVQLDRRSTCLAACSWPWCWPFVTLSTLAGTLNCNGEMDACAGPAIYGPSYGHCAPDCPVYSAEIKFILLQDHVGCVIAAWAVM